MTHGAPLWYARGMPRHLLARFDDASDLSALAQDYRLHQALMLPLPLGDEKPAQFETLALHFRAPGEALTLEAEVLQILPGLGLVLRLSGPEPLTALVKNRPSASPRPPEVCFLDAEPASDLPEDPDPIPEDLADIPPFPEEPDEPDEAPSDRPTDEDESPDGSSPDGTSRSRGGPPPSGLGPAGWPIEKLIAEWNDLTMPQQIQVARHGKAAARRLVMKQNDRTLHHFLLLNPRISVEEVAVMAGLPGLDPDLLRRIANAQEWNRNLQVQRNLVCHPRAPMPLVTRLIEQLPVAEVRTLMRSGRLRASIKRLAMRRVEQGDRRR